MEEKKEVPRGGFRGLELTPTGDRLEPRTRNAERENKELRSFARSVLFSPLKTNPFTRPLALVGCLLVCCELTEKGCSSVRVGAAFSRVRIIEISFSLSFRVILYFLFLGLLRAFFLFFLCPSFLSFFSII